MLTRCTISTRSRSRSTRFSTSWETERSSDLITGSLAAMPIAHHGGQAEDRSRPRPRPSLKAPK